MNLVHVVVGKNIRNVAEIENQKSNKLKKIQWEDKEIIQNSRVNFPHNKSSLKRGFRIVAKSNSQDWIEAKKRCRLNDTDIQMAKRLGMTPKSLIKNIPTPNQQWKAPVKVWIRDLYEEKFNRDKVTGSSSKPFQT